MFTVTAGGFVNLLRERIAEAKIYVENLPGAEEQPEAEGSSTAGIEQAARGTQIPA